jgi:hypothetical protein
VLAVARVPPVNKRVFVLALVTLETMLSGDAVNNMLVAKRATSETWSLQHACNTQIKALAAGCLPANSRFSNCLSLSRCYIQRNA